jgi:hypothetical protein
MTSGTNTPKLSEDERHVLTCVLDEIIPPRADARLPGAGALGLASHIEQTLEKIPELRPLIVHGLADLAAAARARHGQPFGALAQPQKVALLNEQGFLFPLLFHVYTGYYQHPRVVAALGLEPRPPHPKGYEMQPNDLTLLDAVRRRHKMYREV